MYRWIFENDATLLVKPIGMYYSMSRGGASGLNINLTCSGSVRPNCTQPEDVTMWKSKTRDEFSLEFLHTDCKNFDGFI